MDTFSEGRVGGGGQLQKYFCRPPKEKTLHVRAKQGFTKGGSIVKNGRTLPSVHVSSF